MEMATEKQKAQKYLEQTKAAVKALDVDSIFELAEKISSSLKDGGKVIIFGNGGSAADAQHFAAELVGRFEKDRKAMSALALNTNSSIITAIGNDISFDDVFSRQIEALAVSKDVIIAISTSGNSPNILKGVKAAKDKGCLTAGFTGGKGGKLKNAVDISVCVDSAKTADIQVCHIAMIHMLCFMLESAECE